MIAELREKHKEALAKRKEAGTYWPFFFGDINMTRIWRGTDSNFDKADRWFQRFLKVMDENPKIDEEVPVLLERLQQLGTTGDCWVGKFVSDYTDEVFKVCPFILPGANVGASGDPLSVVVCALFDKKAMRAELDWDHYVAWNRQNTIVTTILLDKLSEEQNRMVKTSVIIDVLNSSFAALYDPTFDKMNDKDIVKLQESISAEQLTKMFVIRTPWWMMQLWKIVKKVTPARLLAKVHVCKGDGTADEEFNKYVGDFDFCKPLFDAVKAGTHSIEPEGTATVEARREFSYSCKIKPGETVSWSFQVLSNKHDYLMGIPDIQFSVMLVDEDVIVSKKYRTTDGEVTGSYTCECSEETDSDPLVLSLRWDNSYSKVRKKQVKYSIKEVSDVLAGEDL